MRKALLTLGLLSLSFAGEVFVDVPVTINNTGGCVFDGLPSVIDLGSLPPNAYSVSTAQYELPPVNIPVKCSQGINYTLSFTSLYSSDLSVLLMRSDGGAVKLQLYRDSGRTQLLSSTNLNIASGTGDGTTQNIAIYPRITGCVISSCPPGTYSQTLTLRITY